MTDKDTIQRRRERQEHQHAMKVLEQRGELEATLERLQKAVSEREKQEMSLRLSSPNRRPARQHDHSGLALFRAANEPRLI